MSDDVAKQAEIARKAEERRERVRRENDEAMAASRAKEKETAALHQMAVESKEKSKVLHKAQKAAVSPK
jgi:hypothetical protein